MIAGGIGVTPIMTFAEELARRGAPFSLTYGGRTADSMAFRARLAALGYDTVQPVTTANETLVFALPREIRPARS